MTPILIGDLVITCRDLVYHPSAALGDRRAITAGTLGLVFNRIQGQSKVLIDFGAFQKYVDEQDLVVLDGPADLKTYLETLTQRAGESIVDLLWSQRTTIVERQRQLDAARYQLRTTGQALDETAERTKKLIDTERARADGLQQQVTGLQQQVNSLEAQRTRLMSALAENHRAPDRLAVTANQ